MPNGTYSISVQIGGVAIQKGLVRTADHPNPYEVELPAAAAGDLTTRTDDETGTLTMDDAGHGISTSDVIDLYWEGGARYGITVGTVSGTSVPIGADDSGSGDVLPADGTPITAMTQQIINTQIDGDEVVLLAISAEYADDSSTESARLDFQDSGDSSIEEVELSANVPRVWDIEGGDTNVFTGNPITHCHATHSDAANVCTLKILSLDDSTP